MPHVFISYHHEDRDQAYVVNGHIKGIPLDTFLDDDRLHAGDNWPEELEHALDAASALVVLCTSKAVNSTEVLFEVSYAMGRGIPVIPLRYEREFHCHGSWLGANTSTGPKLRSLGMRFVMSSRHRFAHPSA